MNPVQYRRTCVALIGDPLLRNTDLRLKTRDARGLNRVNALLAYGWTLGTSGITAL